MIPVIARDVMRAVLCEERGQCIPRHLWVHMVHYVVVIVQKQQRKRAAVLDHHGATTGAIMRAMLQKGADFQQ